MSLPRQLHEQLLSAYLDDALSGDERVHVEQMLARDAAVRAELQQMQRLQAETRRALAIPPPGAGERKLDDQFADRVMQAAFAEARQADLPEGHPLRRAADRVAASRDASPSRSGGWASAWGRRQGAALVALAAVLLLAVTLGRPGVDNPVDDPVVAEANGGDTNGGDAAQPADPQPAGQYPEPSAGLAVTEDSVDDGSATATAADQGPAVDSVNSDAAPMIVANDRPDRPTEPSPDGIASAAVNPSPAEPVTPAQPAMDPERRVAAAGAPAALQLPINMVLVLQVEQTELGRADEAVLQALRDAGIRTGIDRAIGQQVVGYLREAKMVASSGEEDEGLRSSILFVEAPGKQLDRFMVSLFQRPEQIARVGLDLGTDPPLVAAASQLSQVEPSQVQHAPDTATAWRLVSGEDRVDFTLPAAGRAFTPVKADMAAGLSAAQGPDILGRLLMVIR